MKEWLENQYGKLVLLAMVLGFSFGIGFILGGSDKPFQVRKLEAEETFQKLHEKEKNFEEIRKQIKLTYYKELLKRPKTKPTENAKSDIEAVLQTESESNQDQNSVKMVNPPSTKRLAEAIANVLGTDTPESVHEVIKKTLPSSTGSAYAVQIASFPNREQAERLLKEMLTKGFDNVRLLQAEIPGRGVVYRVRLHGFQTREEAENYHIKNKLEGIILAQ